MVAPLNTKCFSAVLMLCLAVLSANVYLARSAPSCAADGTMVQCGEEGVHRSRCVSDLDCCFIDYPSGDQLGCYRKNAGYGFCNNNAKRVSCENGQTTQHRCEARGCCWDSSQSPSCFFKNSGTDRAFCPPDRTTEPCTSRPGADDRDTCENGGCCWLPRPAGTAGGSCFKQPPLTPAAPSPSTRPQIHRSTPSIISPPPPPEPVATPGEASAEEVRKIQEQVKSLQEGATVIFENKLYKLTEPLRVTAEHVTFKGLGPKSGLQCADGQNCVYTNVNSFTMEQFIVIGDGSVSILVFDGNKPTSNSDGSHSSMSNKNKRRKKKPPAPPPPANWSAPIQPEEDTGKATSGKTNTKTTIIGTNQKHNRGHNGGEVERGSVIMARNINLEIVDSEFSDNFVTDSGGVLFASKCDVTIIRSTFTNNEAGIKGGAMDVEYGSLTMDRCDFTANAAASFGGAVNTLHTKISMTSTSFGENSAGKGGAAFVQQTANFQLQSAIFLANTATDTGGAIHLDTAKDCQIKDSTFERNTATNRGGAILVSQQSTLTVTSSTFVENSHPPRYEIFVTQNSKCAAISTAVSSNGCPATSKLFAMPIT